MLKNRLRRLLRRAPSAGPPARSAIQPHLEEQAISVLLLSADRVLAESLARIAAVHDWHLTTAPSAGEGRRSLRRAGGVVAIIDRDLPRSDWRDVMPSLAKLPEVAAVLLASGVADDYLWQEVSRFHGHDVLPKPFRVEEVVRAVRFARSWGDAIAGRTRFDGST
jgi:DNA-binding response OmpR family regulator